jgi:uncharacterized protein
MTLSALILGGFAVAMVVATGQPDDAFLAEWQAWHARRVTRLKEPVGWLSLVGLHWLEPGENRIDGLPGTFTLARGTVTLTAPESVGWTLRGAVVTSIALASDLGGRPDQITRATTTAQVIDRSGKLALRVWDSENPGRKGFTGIDTFPVEPRWRFTARWEPYSAPHDVEVPSAVGVPSHEQAPGRAWFTVEGKEYSLEPTLEDDHLFFVFKDRTAPKETYGGGRFLMTAMPQSGKVVLDFNRALNPPCVFTHHATCPLPLPYNVLPFRVDAGEKKWGERAD